MYEYRACQRPCVAECQENEFKATIQIHKRIEKAGAFALCVSFQLLNRRELCDVKLDILLDLSIGQLACDSSILITKVSCLSHVAKETYFHDTGEELNLVQERGWIFHQCWWEGTVNDESAAKKKIVQVNSS